MHDQLGWLSRRAFLIEGAAASAAATLNGRTTAACSLSSEETVGPYYVDRQLLRRDITEGKSGLPLKLQLTVLDSLHCAPLPNAALDIWHCDASGIYSGYTANSPDGMPGMPPGGGFGGRPPGPPPGFGGPGGGMPPGPGFGNRGATDKKTFFRGIQITDASGCVEFTTIYPGWYVGRDTHIHLRVRLGGTTREAKYTGGHVCHTGQLFFPDDVSDEISKIEPYAHHRTPRTSHDEDNVYMSQDGQGSIVSLKKVGGSFLSQGLLATAVVIVNPQATPRETGPGGPGGPPPFPG